MPRLEIDQKPVEVPANATVLDAAKALGIYIPHFCYHKKLSIAANCRMCLVQVEKAPKPLPACATPVTEGMKVYTHSPQAVAAQKGVMEFLLINHPLDCPICDQGGECQLQDLAVGYGGGASRYAEPKRTVANKDLGPLISTDMTRCIHCTRCVRFGQEVAGIMELGMAGRGEHSEILQFVGRSIDSELSGNMIDVCPVGALTSRPFRFSARTWELSRRRSVSPHCGLGSNLTVQVKNDRVMRVLPFENEALNECWLSDRDRFSYEGLNAPDRLQRPLVRGADGAWTEADWPQALEAVARGLRGVIDADGPGALAALGTPHATVEELYLLRQLMQGLGSPHVDFRTRQTDFRLDGARSGTPWLGMAVADLEALDRVLVVGSSLRQDHSLIAQRLRRAARKGQKLSVIQCLGEDLLQAVEVQCTVRPTRLPAALAEVVVAVAQLRGAQLPPWAAGLAGVVPGDSARRVAESLASGARAGIFLGNFAQAHPRGADLHRLGRCLAELLGAGFGFLGEAANSVGGYLAGAVPATGGLDAAAMFAQPRSGYVLLHAEPEFDCAHPAAALAALRAARFTVALTPFADAAKQYAHVILPIAPFTETAGTYVNTEGRLQSFTGVVRPLGETRPGWKVLRVLADLLSVSGCAFDAADAVLAAALPAGVHGLDNGVQLPDPLVLGQPRAGLERVSTVGIYRADPLVRRSAPLQARRPQGEEIGLAPQTAAQLQLADGQAVEVRQGGSASRFRLRITAQLAEGCVHVPAATVAAAHLGSADGEVTLAALATAEEVDA